MKKLVLCASFLLSLGLLTGCEWESSSDSGTWDSSFDWVNFTGLYRDPSGQYLVRQYGLAGTPAGQNLLGTGNGLNASFGGVLSSKPVVKGSLTVTDGTETFTDAAGTGVLVGSAGGTGSINYETGAITVDFFLAPADGQSVMASYQFFAAGTAENPVSGATGGDIYTFNVIQHGNQLTFVDNNGARYEGSLVLVGTPGGRDPATIIDTDEEDKAATEEDGAGAAVTELSSEVIAQFDVRGTSVSGNPVSIVGTLQLDPARGKRIMRATWIEAGGQTGDIIGEAASLGAAAAGVTT